MSMLVLTAILVCGAPVTDADAPAPREATVRVDERIELLAVIQSLGEYERRTNLITNFDFPYKRDVAGHFAPFAQHAAVKMFDELSAAGFSFDGPVSAVLHLDGPPEFKPRAEFSEYVCGRAGSREKLEGFFDAMREFHRDSKFHEFFERHAAFYERIVADTKAKMAGISIATLEDYYGLKKHGYTIILAPLLHPGGFGPQITLPDGTLDIFSVNGPQGMADDRPSFGSEDNLRYLVWHEFSHSFMNPLSARHPEIVRRTATLFEPLAKPMKRQAYATWEICVNEHLVRAATVRFSFREQGDEAGAAALKEEQSRSFEHVQALAEKLKVYESQRDKYPTINDFAAELLGVFDTALADQAANPAAARPKVVKSVPETGAKGVDPSLTELRVEFDADMNTTSYSWVKGAPGEFPEMTGKPRWEGKRVCVLPVKLKPGTTYWLGLNSGRFTGFVNAKGVTAEEFELMFTTAPSP